MSMFSNILGSGLVSGINTLNYLVVVGFFKFKFSARSELDLSLTVVVIRFSRVEGQDNLSSTAAYSDMLGTVLQEISWNLRY